MLQMKTKREKQVPNYDCTLTWEVGRRPTILNSAFVIEQRIRSEDISHKQFTGL